MKLAAMEPWVGTNTTIKCFDVLTCWVEALHGTGDTADAMQGFVELFQCDAALLVRIAQGSGAANCVAKAITAPQKLFPPRPALPLIHEISHPYFGNVNRGTVWCHSKVDDRALWKTSDTLDDLMRQQSIGDVVIVVLETKAMIWDFFEFHFSAKVSPQILNLIEPLAQALAKSWSARVPGTAARLQNRLRLVHKRPAADVADAPILGISNPVGLSRCEYRICRLIQHGMRTKSIAAELGIRQNTVRSHLHSIYAKTETSGQFELLHRLAQDQNSSAALGNIHDAQARPATG